MKKLIFGIVLAFFAVFLMAGEKTNFGKYVEVIGINNDVAATDEPVWINSGALPALLTTAEVLDIDSTSVEDDGVKSPAGTGIWSIRLTGLDTNYNIITEVVVMDGTTNINTTLYFLRLNYVEAVTAGTGLAAAGNITISNNAVSVTLAYIPTGYNNTLQAIYCVPANRTLHAKSIYWGEMETKDTDITIFYRETGSNKPWLTRLEFKVLDDMKIHSFLAPLIFQAKTDLYIAARSAGAAGKVSAGLIGTLE